MSILPAFNMGLLSGSGVTLSQPHKSGIQSSLPLLKKNYKFSHVFLWGKIMGMTGDYLIAMGVEDSYAVKKMFYCQDGVSWAQLPLVTPELMEDCEKVATVGRQLSGDIAKIYALPVEPLPEGEEGEPPAPKTVTEEQRLAVMVMTIEMECAMVPMGSLMKKADGSIVDSPTYSGLDFAKAKSLKSYVFVNKPKDPAVTASAVSAATDFLTPCDTIVPTGSLVSKFDEPLGCVTFRSLVYPGFLAYTVVGSPLKGYCYFGTGEKNLDIAFMLP